MADEVKVVKPAKLSVAKEVWLAIYGWGKKVALQVFGGLVMDKKADDLWVVSMTKVATWIVLGHSLYVWNQVIQVAGETAGMIARQDVSQGELYTLMTLLGVTGVKIGAKAVTDAMATKYPSGAVQFPTESP